MITYGSTGRLGASTNKGLLANMHSTQAWKHTCISCCPKMDSICGWLVDRCSMSIHQYPKNISAFGVCISGPSPSRGGACLLSSSTQAKHKASASRRTSCPKHYRWGRRFMYAQNTGALYMRAGQAGRETAPRKAENVPQPKREARAEKGMSLEHILRQSI
jgi:hypothetical protein